MTEARFVGGVCRRFLLDPHFLRLAVFGCLLTWRPHAPAYASQLSSGAIGSLRRSFGHYGCSTSAQVSKCSEPLHVAIELTASSHIAELKR
jgi:hypothetical protein